MTRGSVLTSNLSRSKYQEARERIRRGEKLGAEERLDILSEVVNFSPRDWAAGEDDWEDRAIWELVNNKLLGD